MKYKGSYSWKLQCEQGVSPTPFPGTVGNKLFEATSWKGAMQKSFYNLEMNQTSFSATPNQIPVKLIIWLLAFFPNSCCDLIFCFIVLFKLPLLKDFA